MSSLYRTRFRIYFISFFLFLLISRRLSIGLLTLLNVLNKSVNVMFIPWNNTAAIQWQRRFTTHIRVHPEQLLVLMQCLLLYLPVQRMLCP